MFNRSLRCRSPRGLLPLFGLAIVLSIPIQSSAQEAEAECKTGTCTLPTETEKPKVAKTAEADGAAEGSCDSGEPSLFDAFNGATSEVPAMPT